MAAAQRDSPAAGLPRALVVLLGLAAAVVVVAGLRSMQDLLGPAFLALILTIVIHPLRRRLETRMPALVATLVCVVVQAGLVLGMGLALVLSMARLASLLPEYSDDAADLVDDALAGLDAAGVAPPETSTMAESLDLEALADLVSGVLDSLFGLVSSLAFVIALGFFMTLDGRTAPQNLAVARRSRPALVDALATFARQTRRYFVVATVFGLVVAAFDTVALALLGIPAPLVWGLLAFLTNYIPNIGFVIGLIPPALLGLLEGGWELMLWVIVVYCALNFVIQSIIQPKVVGDVVGLSTTLSFVSLGFWTWVLGPSGALLAIPASLLFIALLVDADPGAGWVRALLANADPGRSARDEMGPGHPAG
jgi:predicted PurR-regulated permease PerM